MRSLRLQALLSAIILLLITVEAVPRPNNSAKTSTTAVSKTTSTSTTRTTTTTSKSTSKSTSSSSSSAATSTVKKSSSTSATSLKTTSTAKSTTSSLGTSSSKKSTTTSSSVKTTSKSSSTTVKSTSTIRTTSSIASKTSTTLKTTTASSSQVSSTGITATVCTLVADSKVSCGLQGGCCKTDDDCCALYGCAGEITGGIFGVCTSKLPLPSLPVCNVTQQAVQGVGGKCFLNGGCCNEDTDCCAGTECAGNAGQSEAGVCLSLSEIESGNITNILGTVTEKQIIPQMTATVTVIVSCLIPCVLIPVVSFWRFAKYMETASGIFDPNAKDG